MISAEDPLKALRSAIAENAAIQTVSTEGGEEVVLGDALYLQIQLAGSQDFKLFSLDTSTRFKGSEGAADLRTIWNAWKLKGLSVADYISTSDDLNQKHLRLLERSQLISWLNGTVDKIEAIEDSPGDKISAEAQNLDAVEAQVDSVDSVVKVDVETVQRTPVPSALEKITRKEHDLTNHNKFLHGSKEIDFSSVSLECRRLVFDEFKANIPWTKAAGGSSVSKAESRWVPLDERRSASKSVAPAGPGPLVQEGKNKEPIILVSSSPSSILNMANAKDFLESGIFKPLPKSSGSPNILRLSRELKNIGRTRFIVVDSVDQFKPEYWGRVVAVFVTGQAWQFKPYYWSDPHQLFRHCLGFCLIYNGDPIPAAVSQWNSKVEKVDRTHRFRDTEVVEKIWSNIEDHMISRGWPLKKT